MKDVVRKRLAYFEQAVKEGKSMAQCAAELGTSRAAVTMWFDRNGFEHVREALRRGNSWANKPRTEEEVLHILRTVKSYDKAKGGARAAAEALGMTYAALRYWIKRNAPWGIDDAIGDYEELVPEESESDGG